MNLEKEYKRLNTLLFEDILPTNIPLSWFTSRRIMGKTHAQFTVEEHNYVGASIAINDLYDCTYQEHLDILAHEMIHLFIASQGFDKKGGNQHNPLFLEHMTRINSSYPEYNITSSDNIDRPVNVEKVPLMHGFLLVLQNGDIFYNVYKEEITRQLFSYILYSLHTVPRLHSAIAYTFSGKYPELISSHIRTKEKTLIYNLQFIKDKRTAKAFYEKIKKTAPFRCPLTLEETS